MSGFTIPPIPLTKDKEIEKSDLSNDYSFNALSNYFNADAPNHPYNSIHQKFNYYKISEKEALTNNINKLGSLSKSNDSSFTTLSNYFNTEAPSNPYNTSPLESNKYKTFEKDLSPTEINSTDVINIYNVYGNNQIQSGIINDNSLSENSSQKNETLLDPLKEKALLEAERYVKANPNQDSKLYKFAGYHSGEPGKPIDCSGMVSQCVFVAGGGYLNNVPTIDGKRVTNLNGVANIINQPNVKSITNSDVQRGDLVTLENDKTYNNIPVGHIAFIASVKRNKEGELTELELYHSRGSKGPVFQKVILNDTEDSYYKLFGSTFNYWRFTKGNNTHKPSSSVKNNNDVNSNFISIPDIVKKAITITNSVGESGVNSYLDSMIIKELLFKRGYKRTIESLSFWPTVNEEVISYIKDFQKNILKMREPDGLVEPNKSTFWALVIGRKTTKSERKMFNAFIKQKNRTPINQPIDDERQQETTQTETKKTFKKSKITFNQHSNVTISKYVDFSEGKNYVEKLSNTQKENIETIIEELNNQGFVNNYDIAAIISICSKESELSPKSERMHYTAKRLVKIFSSYFPSEKYVIDNGYVNPETKKADSEYYQKKIANKVYARYGSDKEGDGWKYRGRGFNQLTFKGSYRKRGEYVGIDLVSDPDQLNNPKIAAKVLAVFMEKKMKSLKSQEKLKSYSVTERNKFKNIEDAVYAYFHCNTGTGKKTEEIFGKITSDSGMKKAQQRAPYFLQYLNKINPSGKTNIFEEITSILSWDHFLPKSWSDSKEEISNKKIFTVIDDRAIIRDQNNNKKKDKQGKERLIPVGTRVKIIEFNEGKKIVLVKNLTTNKEIGWTAISNLKESSIPITNTPEISYSNDFMELSTPAQEQRDSFDPNRGWIGSQINNDQYIDKVNIPENFTNGISPEWAKILDKEEKKLIQEDSDPNVIYMTRKWERWTGKNASSATFSEFKFGNLKGYMTEPHGKETAKENKDKRIPVGTYNLKWHVTKKYPKNKYTLQSEFGKDWNLDYPKLKNGVLCLYNEKVSTSRGILIHAGQDGGWTVGCILPSTALNKEVDKRNVKLKNSVEILHEILKMIDEKGIKNVKLVIRDEIK